MHDIITEFLEKHLASFDYVMLTGSYVENNFRQHSDIDVIIFSRTTTEETFERITFHGVTFELIILPLIEVEKILIKDHISRSGVYTGLLSKAQIIKDKDDTCQSIVDASKNSFEQPDNNYHVQLVNAQLNSVEEYLKDFSDQDDFGMNVFSLGELLNYFTSVSLILNKFWTGSGKWRGKFLKIYLPELYEELLTHVNTYYRTGDKLPLAHFCEMHLSIMRSSIDREFYATRKSPVNYFRADTLAVTVPRDHVLIILNFYYNHLHQIQLAGLHHNIYYKTPRDLMTFILTLKKKVDKRKFLANLQEHVQDHQDMNFFSDLRSPAYVTGGNHIQKISAELMNTILAGEKLMMKEFFQSSTKGKFFIFVLLGIVRQRLCEIGEEVQANQIFSFLQQKHARLHLDQARSENSIQLRKQLKTFTTAQEAYVRNNKDKFLISNDHISTFENIQDALVKMIRDVWVKKDSEIYLAKFKFQYLSMEYGLTKHGIALIYILEEILDWKSYTSADLSLLSCAVMILKPLENEQ